MTAEHLEYLLEEMNLAIKSAEFAKLDRLLPEVELATQAVQTGVSRTDLQRLQSKAKQNASAAISAGHGVRAALRRIKEIQENAVSLRTYDRHGQRADVTAAGEISRRL